MIPSDHHKVIAINFSSLEKPKKNPVLNNTNTCDS